jgi:ribosomal protein L7/L12
MSYSNDMPEDAVRAINAGKNIQAVKIVREHSGLGLKEAMDLVVAYERGEHVRLPARPAIDPALSPEVIVLLNEGQTIPAIKLLREETGLGLKEAKDLVDAYQARQPGAQPREVKSGCLSLLLLGLGLGATLAAWLV